MKQLLLKGEGCSGRGVRVEVLTTAAREAIFESAAKDVGPEATMLDLRRREDRSGICAFVVAVSEKTGFKTKDELVGAAWKNVSAEHLEGKLGDYFTTKDVAALITIFRKLHDVTQKEIDDILGEALDVAAD